MFERLYGTRPGPQGGLTVEIDSPAYLFTHGAILDTRGYLLYRTGKRANLEQALADLHQAIDDMVHAEKILSSLPSYMAAEPSSEGDPAGDFKSGLAAVYYHRSLVQAALGHRMLAELDLDAVRRLGSKPGKDLW